MFGPRCLLPSFEPCLCLSCLVCARLRVRLLEVCIAKAVFFCFCRNMHFLGFTVLPWQAKYYRWRWVAPVRAQLRPRHGTTATITAVIFYYRWKSGTTALCAVLPPGWYYRDDPRYYRAVASGWGLRAGQGEFQLPHTHSSLFPTPSLSLLPKNGAGGPRRISVSGRSCYLLSTTLVFP